MIDELKKRLEKFQYIENAEISEDEMKTLKEMFSVENSFKVLFKYLCVVEGEKGSQLVYDIENLPTKGGQYSAEEVADELKFKQLVLRFVRMKMETIRSSFEKEAIAELEEEEKKIKEEREKNEKLEKEAESERKGISPDM